MPTREERLDDYRELKRLLAGLWGLLGPESASLLRDAVQQFVCWPVPDTAEPAQLLQHLERAGLLSENAVSILLQLCALAGGGDGGGGGGAGRLVQRFSDKYSLGSKVDRRPLPGTPCIPPASATTPGEWWPTSNCELYKSQSSLPHSARRDWVGGSVSQLGREAMETVEPGPDAHHIGGSAYSAVSRLQAPQWHWTEPSGSSASGTEQLGGAMQVQTRRPDGTGLPAWPPLESAQSSSPETEQGRMRSMAVWGHASPTVSPVPQQTRAAPQAVCECHIAHRQPPPPPPRRPEGAACSVQQVLDWRPAGRGSEQSTGERRGLLVNFLSRRLGGRYLQLAPHLETVTPAELAEIRDDMSSDLVSSARRLLTLYLSRHEAGDVEAALSRRLRRARCTRLADELDIWTTWQDRLEEDRQHRPLDSTGSQTERYTYPPPYRVPRMACC